jgi:hypothetical protein
MINVERCKKIINRLRKDFPVLEKVNLEIKIKKLNMGSMRIERHLFNKYSITIGLGGYDDATDEELMGSLAHELCHLEDFEKVSYLSYLFNLVKYLLSKKVMVKSEIKNDMKTIRKGYGRELAASRLYREKKNPSNRDIEKNKRPFMLSEEIKQEMKKLK